MRILIFSIALCLITARSAGQKHNFFVQVMPHGVARMNSEALSRYAFYPVPNIVRMDTIDDKPVQMRFGYLGEQQYTPLATIALGFESKGRFFYQVTCGLQLARTDCVYYDGWRGPNNIRDYEYGYSVSESNSLRDSVDFGPRPGTTFNPTIEMGLGYSVTRKDKVFVKAGLWSYSLAYQRCWENFSVGLSMGKLFDVLANKVQIGPWMRAGDAVDPNIERTRNNPVWSAYVNINLSAFREIGKSSSDETPKEF
jgi:hypothetical protein